MGLNCSAYAEEHFADPNPAIVSLKLVYKVNNSCDAMGEKIMQEIAVRVKSFVFPEAHLALDVALYLW